MYTGENNNKMALKYNEHGDVEVDSFDSGHSIVVGICDCSNEASHPTTEKKFLDYPSTSYTRSTLLHWDTSCTKDHVHNCNANTSKDEEFY